MKGLEKRVIKLPTRLLIENISISMHFFRGVYFNLGAIILLVNVIGRKLVFQKVWKRYEDWFGFGF